MSAPTLGEGERVALLALARAAIGDAVRGDDGARSLLDEASRRPGLQACHGLFVTLYRHEREGGRTVRRLRGCIGTLEADEPLYRAVWKLAPRASLEDPRFPPLETGELERVSISLSVLTPLVRLDDPERIVPGRDGVELQRGKHRAVFLPQVAVEQGWDRERLLEQLAGKAGLRPEEWRGAEISVFRSVSFGEPGSTSQDGT